MANNVKGLLAVSGVVGIAALVGYFFASDMGRFAGLRDKRATTSASQITSESGGNTAVAAPAAEDGAQVGTLNGKAVLRSDMTSAEKLKIFEAEMKVHEAYEEILARRYMNDFFEKYKRDNNIADTNAAREAYVKSKVNIPEDQIKRIVEANKNNERLKNLSPDDQLKEVRNALEGQARQGVVQDLMRQGRDKGGFVVSLPKPIEPRVDVGDGGNAFLGPKDAKVTIVEWADYQCPYCARMVPTLLDVVKKYDGKVRWVYRDFPLDFHPNAMPAAIAANCAGAQGKYFEAHNFLFENSAALGEETYKKMVDKLKLNVADFDKCRKNPDSKKEPSADMEAGVEVGVNGTPAYFINGRRFSGGMGVAEFSKAIEEELAK